jgi:predicted HTH domain antitoxin
MMNVVIPDEIVNAAQITEEELLWEIAVNLLKKQRITLEQASHLLRMNKLELLDKLTTGLISTKYNADAVYQIINTMCKQGW